MKKIFCLILSVVFIACIFSGCFAAENTEEQTTEQVTDTTEDVQAQENELTATISGSLQSFDARLFAGGSFTKDDFAKYDITIINFWGTFCVPCLDEMPALEEYRHTLPDNVNFITFCTDGVNNDETVRSCLDETGLTAPVIIAADGDFADVLNQIQYIPTTVFINSSGEIVGTEIIGRVDDLPTTFNAHLNEALTMA